MSAKGYKHGSKYEQVRKISKTGIYSYYVTMPKDYMDELGWSVGDDVRLSLDHDRIIITKEPSKAGKGGEPTKTRRVRQGSSEK